MPGRGLPSHTKLCPHLCPHRNLTQVRQGCSRGQSQGGASWGPQARGEGSGSLSGRRERCLLPGQQGQRGLDAASLGDQGKNQAVPRGRGTEPPSLPPGLLHGTPPLPQPPSFWARVCRGLSGWGQGWSLWLPGPGYLRMGVCTASVQIKGAYQAGAPFSQPPFHTLSSPTSQQSLPWQCSCGLPAHPDPPSRPSSGTSPEAFPAPVAPWA